MLRGWSVSECLRPLIGTVTENIVTPSLNFNLFQRFATSELTHSGIWGWIVQSLDDACPPELHELRPAASALLARIGVKQLESPIVVTRERTLSGEAGRVDLEVKSGRGVVVLETKVKARPDLAQRDRYEAAYQGELLGIAIISTTFDEPWDEVGLKHVGAADLLMVLKAGRYKSDVMQQYVAWLEATLAERTAALDRALCDDADICCKALRNPSAQWGVMRQIAGEIGASTDTRLDAGQNRDGSAWTQLSFSPGGPPHYDALFYRIESRDSHAAEFTLRQYQKPADSQKAERLIRLRKIFGEAVSASVCPMGFNTAPRYARMRAQEAKVAQVTIPDATPAELIAYLPPVHRRFAERIEEAGWPLGPG